MRNFGRISCTPAVQLVTKWIKSPKEIYNFKRILISNGFLTKGSEVLGKLVRM